MTPNPLNPTQTEDWVMADPRLIEEAISGLKAHTGSATEETQTRLRAMLSAAPTISPGMSELRGLLEKATPGPWARGAWYGKCSKPSHGVNNHTGRNGPDPCKYDFTFEAGTAISSSVENIYIASVDLDGLTEPDAALIVAAVNALPTLLDDLAAAQGEIERLREALQIMVDEQVDYMTRNKLGDPEKQHTIRVARSALTLKSEKEMGLSRDLRPQPVASEPKNSDVQQVKPCSMCFGKLKPEEDGGRECESCGAVWVEGT
jgi:hypothetical protein